MFNMLLVLIFQIAFLSFGDVSSARILALYPVAGRSHVNAFGALTTALAERGHNVTVFTPFKTVKDTENHKEIVPEALEDYMGRHMGNMFEVSPFKMFGQVISLGTESCKLFIRAPEVQELLKSNEKFDVIIVSAVINECSLGLIHRLKAPFIGFSPAGIYGRFTLDVGNPDPYAYVPNIIFPFTDHMSFTERLVNVVGVELFDLMRDYVTLPLIQKILFEELGSDIPPLRELEKNASLIFANNHFSMNYVRPYNPNAIEVGGLHCRPAKPLPQDLQDFIDGSGDHGVIYFSMGTVLRSTNMDEEKRNIFITVFKQLPQRIIWKFESDDFPGLPKNVKIVKWAPQQDILGHPKVKLFISHGGLLSTQEAVYHGVPTVGLPIFGDQSLNVKASGNAGYAVPLDFKSITVESLLSAINTALHDPSYEENVKRRSTVLRDQLQTPLERAVFWTEYVIRHKGARHLRSAALDLNWYQLHLLDIIAVVLLGGVTITVIVVGVVRFIVNKLCGRKSQKVKEN